MQKHRKAFNSESSCSGEQVQPRDLHSKLASHWGSQSLTYIRNHSEKHRKIWLRHTFKLVEPPVVGELLEWIAILSKMFAEVNRFRQLHRVPAVRMVLVQHIKDRAERAASNLCSEKQQITVIWWNVYYELFVTVLFHCVIFCIVVYCIFNIILLYVAQSAAPWIWKQTLLQAGVWRDFHAGPRNAVDGNHKTKWWVSSEPNVTLVGCSGLVCAFAVNRSDMICYPQSYIYIYIYLVVLVLGIVVPLRPTNVNCRNIQEPWETTLEFDCFETLRIAKDAMRYWIFLISLQKALFSLASLLVMTCLLGIQLVGCRKLEIW